MSLQLLPFLPKIRLELFIAVVNVLKVFFELLVDHAEALGLNHEWTPIDTNIISHDVPPSPAGLLPIVCEVPLWRGDRVGILTRRYLNFLEALIQPVHHFW